MRILPVILGLSLLCLSNTTIDSSIISQRQPRVFIMEENELLIDELSEKYDKALIEACGNDLDKAHQKWVGTLAAMERYAKDWNYNIIIPYI